MRNNEPSLVEARGRLGLLSNSLPVAVDPAVISLVAKTPTTALVYRAAQAWRMEEFARCACDTFERGDLVVAASNTRHAAECCAGVWYLYSLLEKAIADPALVDETHEKIVRLTVGYKMKLGEGMPEAINALTMVKKLDEIIPGYFGGYERLSEIAHPNWSGSAAIFSHRDDKTLITHFGRGLRDTKNSERLVLNCLIGAVELFGHAFNKIDDIKRDYVAVCEADIIKRESAGLA
jgi:hypothetical protein